MIRCAQRTLYGVDLDLHRLLGQTYTPLSNTTLNEKFGILTDLTPSAGTYPTIAGFVIGVGGTTTIDNNTNYVYNEHSPIDGALFKHIPFVMRTVANDLTSTEKANYRLRVVETINSVQYACYYMKALGTDFTLPSSFYRIQTTHSVENISDAILAVFDQNIDSILNPEPVTKNISYDTHGEASYILKKATLTFSLTESDLEELNNVMDILGYSEQAITEIGICSGIETTTTDGYTDVYASQILYHVGVNFTLATDLLTSYSITQGIEIGGMEPLYYNVTDSSDEE